MACHLCGAPAVALDLCHGRHPVCAAHTGIGHQVEPVQAAPKKRGR